LEPREEVEVKMRDRVAVDLVVHLERSEQLVQGTRHHHRLSPEGHQLVVWQQERLFHMPLGDNACVARQRRGSLGGNPCGSKLGNDVQRAPAPANRARIGCAGLVTIGHAIILHHGTETRKLPHSSHHNSGPRLPDGVMLAFTPIQPRSVAMRDDDNMDPPGSEPDSPPSEQQPEPAFGAPAPADPPPPPPPPMASEPAPPEPTAASQGSLWDRIKAAIGM
jgi:hypothetical protein